MDVEIYAIFSSKLYVKVTVASLLRNDGRCTEYTTGECRHDHDMRAFCISSYVI